MNDELKNKVIRMAWEDRTTFDEIHKKTGLAEGKVIKVMRANLKPSSFRMWRKRVSGRITKHAGRFRESRLQIKRVSGRDILNQQESE
ncbi:TIGR03643 family protein [Akkermansiaceae bacterium]|nr:TIGR03643 family protein [Akkermansiaceae bacterium]MDB4574407.1 TIGR03643 family protein [Akkermansiaceae bacterium]MDB4607653.1 TIGR03643 family protein [bacterium]MDC0304621.1 TIGR03643 family protein [Akkermansiaceae bacterium]